MATPAPFAINSPTRTLSVTATSGDIALPTTGGNVVMLTNEGPNHCYIAAGSGTQTATVPTTSVVVTATPVLAGTQVTFSLPQLLSAPHLAAVCDTNLTATLRISVGEGV